MFSSNVYFGVRDGAGRMATYNAYGCDAQSHDDDDDQPLRGYEDSLETCGVYVRLLDSPDHENNTPTASRLDAFCSFRQTQGTRRRNVFQIQGLRGASLPGWPHPP